MPAPLKAVIANARQKVYFTDYRAMRDRLLAELDGRAQACRYRPGLCRRFNPALSSMLAPSATALNLTGERPCARRKPPSAPSSSPSR